MGSEMRLTLILWFALSALGLGAARAEEPWFFAVISDPQFGMYAKDSNFAQETANFEFAVANLNRLHPRFIVVCGDLVNRQGDADEIAEYKRILKQVDPSIPVYSVAGNHDMGNVPATESLVRYRRNFGKDYYTFSLGDFEGIVLNSNLISASGALPDESMRQEEWLKSTLNDAQLNPHRTVVVFQHIPYFVSTENEPDGYFNMATPARRRYLDLLEQAGIRYVFCGHYHRNAGSTDRELTEVVTGAGGMPLGGSLSGFRIVIVRGRRLDSTWVCFGGIPNQVDLQKGISTPCAQ